MPLPPPPTIAMLRRFRNIREAWVDHGFACQNCTSIPGADCSEGLRLHGAYVLLRLSIELPNRDAFD